MEIAYFDDKKHAVFNGEKFTRDDRTGYYLTTRNSTLIGRRLHRVVWEYHHGTIPNGYHIHHIDHDKSNNAIENLKMLTVEQHIDIHKDELTEEEKQWYRSNLEQKARPKAVEWHKSVEGRNWHKRHYQQSKEKLHAQQKYVCEMCGNEFLAINNGKNRFCSNACKSAFRRKNGQNKEKRFCVICGNAFLTDKYKKTVTCSPKCAAILKNQKRGNSA